MYSEVRANEMLPLRISQGMRRWLAVLLLFSFQYSASAFTVKSAETSLVDGVYVLDLNIDYVFSQQMVEALHRGVKITVVLDLEFLRKREYWWDERVTALQQRYELRFHALSQQYILSNLNSGVQHNFPGLNAALAVMGTVVGVPVLDRHLLEEGERYWVRLRARVDVDALPIPLRLRSLVSSSWDLESEWFSWELAL